MANNNYPQITSVTSEALQSQIRNLLPSQEGFGTDLMAQNVIVPIIDLTSAAEGSSVGENLQTALAFGSQTAFDAFGAGTTTIINNTGFFRIVGTLVQNLDPGSGQEASINITDGLSVKKVWGAKQISADTGSNVQLSFDLVVFLDSGESVTLTRTSRSAFLGSTRQIADINGILVNPSGFNPQ